MHVCMHKCKDLITIPVYINEVCLILSCHELKDLIMMPAKSNLNLSKSNSVENGHVHSFLKHTVVSQS